MDDCQHEYLIVETTEKIAQYYNPIVKEWGDKLDWDGPILSVDEIECADCHEIVTNQFRKQVEGELGLSSEDR